jgi:hypothetical protein
VSEPEKFREWPAVDKDGWCEWQMPVMQGYKLKCCDCGLVHEVEFNVAEWRGRQRVEFRMRRAAACQDAPHWPAHNEQTFLTQAFRWLKEKLS